jgi:hypothetical protein
LELGPSDVEYYQSEDGDNAHQDEDEVNKPLCADNE